MTNATPRDILDAHELKTQKPLDASAAAGVLRYTAHQIQAGYINPDEWKVGGLLNTEDGERRLEGNLANYLLANIEVTGRKLRHDVMDDAAAVRVRLTFDTGNEDERYTQTLGWMLV